MPQGPAHLHARFGDDGTAWAYLRRRGYRNGRGVINPPWVGYVMTDPEWDAVVYLVQEWDWWFDRSGAPGEAPGGSMVSQARRWLLRVSSGPLRVWDKYEARWAMWWICVAKYELRKRWYYATGRREEWDGDPLKDIQDL